MATVNGIGYLLSSAVVTRLLSAVDQTVAFQLKRGAIPPWCRANVVGTPANVFLKIDRRGILTPRHTRGNAPARIFTRVDYIIQRL
jgi:hypothetical protein